MVVQVEMVVVAKGKLLLRSLAFTQNNHDDLFVRISTVRDSLLLVFRKNRQLFLELLASIGINDIIVPQKMGVGVGWGGGGGAWWSRRRWW
jgi:hypothetical protein